MSEDDTSAPKQSMTAARGVKLILIAQLVIAGVLIASDFARVLPRLGFAPDAPRLTQPVLPGDQTRRYDRRNVPSGPQAPDTGDMPSRLNFELAGNTLMLVGAIAEGDADRFEEWLQRNTLPPIIELHSTGGSVTDALLIGKRLRAEKVTTRVNAGQVCLSACPYLLAAGTHRHVHDKGYVGVHQHYFGENTALPAFLAVEDIQRGQGEVMTYLIAMGIDPALMQHALVTPPEAIYILVPKELTQYALATEITEV